MDKIVRLAFVAVLFGFLFAPGTSDGTMALAAGESFVQSAKLVASDSSVQAGFGKGVAVSEDTIVVGAPYHDSYRGAAYVFVKPNSGWEDANELAILSTSDYPGAEQYFGYCVAISGDTIVVGSYNGTAYVFVKPPSGWGSATITARLTGSDGGVGCAVATSSDVIVAGAHVFVKPAGGWVDATETAKLSASDGAANDRFGDSVAISGDAIIIGASRGNGLKGAAYVFGKPPGGWVSGTELAKLTASDGAADDYFGVSVAGSGATVIVGARLDDIDPIANQGSVYVFEKPETGWTSATENAKLVASDPEAGASFGVSVAMSGNVITVGDWASVGGYAFLKPVSGWVSGTESEKLFVPGLIYQDKLGYAVSVSGNTAVVTAPAGGDSNHSGAAYVFTPSTCQVTAPTLLNPTDNKRVKKTTIRFDWTDAGCATKYKVVVRKETHKGARVLSKTVTVSEWNALFEGQTAGRYVWRVKACDASGCLKPTDWASFRYVP